MALINAVHHLIAPSCDGILHIVKSSLVRRLLPVLRGLLGSLLFRSLVQLLIIISIRTVSRPYCESGSESVGEERGWTR